MERNFEINKNGHNIRCKLFCGKISDIKRVFVYCHGFAGHKDNRAAARFAEKAIAKNKDIALVIFNWPCHGDDVKKKLQLSDCDEYLTLVLEYVKEQYAPSKLYAYATSFGAYMVLRYIKQFANPFDRIILRCPAVNMYEVLTEIVMNPEELELLEKNKPVQVGFDRKIEMNLPFLADVKASNVCEMEFIDFADDILIIHGTKDEIIPIDLVKDFADENVIECIVVENADHRFQHQTHMDYATKVVLEFIGGK